MSLVAYDSSDENSEDEELELPKNDTTQIKTVENTKKVIEISDSNLNTNDNHEEQISRKIHLENLPKPKNTNVITEDIEEDDNIPFVTETLSKLDTSIKKQRGPIKITIPSLSEFKDVEKEEEERKLNKIAPSQKGCGLFHLLPPPKLAKGTSTLKPAVLRSQSNNDKNKTTQKNPLPNKTATKNPKMQSRASIVESSYDSNSEDEDTQANSSESNIDFFGLTTKEPQIDEKLLEEMASKEMENNIRLSQEHSKYSTSTSTSNKTLIKSIANEAEDTTSEDQTEIGPRLPNPQQEYNLDSEGNIALDDKAIEHLCGKRGVKRKGLALDEVNIIDINGEDIKPDEREWLVKALTEDPVQRPISMQNSGMNSQSKKKHQITYLAHQAKAMEMELKNQWAQNRMTRKQTQSKYGF